MEVTDAIQYLKANGFTENKTYSWINPLLNKLLNSELNNDDVDKLISTITKKHLNTQDNTEIESVITATCEFIPNSKIELSEIKEISSVNNFGLLNIEEPVKLKSGLNVFYGMNGVGKSSIYKAICGALGTDNKKCVPNVNSNSSSMLSKIKIKDKQGNEKTLEFSGDKEESLDVRIFDNEISRYIVSNDHENEFIVPYLKQEYFFILRDLLDTVSERLTGERNNIYARINEIKQLFDKKLDFIKQDYKIIEKKIKDAKFTDKDKQVLEDLNKNKVMLESDTTKVVLQSYNDRIADIDKILKKLCTIAIVDDKPIYSLMFGSEFIESYKVDLDNYLKCKDLFECNNLEKMGEYIPKDWINKKEWYSFVEAGLSFVASLTEEDKALYTDNKCPFCNQNLTDKSKELIKNYDNLKNTCKANMDKHKTIIGNFKKEIVDVLNFIEDIEETIFKVFDVIKEIDDKQVNDFKDSDIKTYLEAIKACLEKYESIEVKGLDGHSSSINRIINFRNILNDKIVIMIKQTSEKDKEIENINNSIKPIEANMIIIENVVILNELIDKLKIIEDIDKKMPNITTLKSSLSKNQTNFSNESIMKMFKDKLYEEYKELHFDPPKKLIIKPQKNKRLCRVGEYKVSDIYSEGEMKIHSLAEFFAKAQVDQFKGVYIFDDPVNSLDYERIEYVKNRIKKLDSKDNQVLVFTHNIYFLNSLVNTEKDKICEVVKTDDQICIINDNILGDKDKSVKQYKGKIDKRMKDLNSRDIPSEIDAMDLSAVYDLMSGCLENYVENILLKGLISRYRPNIRMYSLTELKSINNDIVDKIYELYNNTSRYGNRHDSPSEALSPTFNNLKAHYGIFNSIIDFKP
jgi:hypothetical protein